MIDGASRREIVHRWYTRPVFFVTDLNRAARFYLEKLGFEKVWHEGDGAGKVCQVNHGECEIILCEDATRRDRGRVFIELTSEALVALRRELLERSVPTEETWWGYETLRIDDPDGNELFFPRPERAPSRATDQRAGRLVEVERQSVSVSEQAV